MLRLLCLLLSGIWLGSAAPIRGVNLGGWLVLEPWITPKLFEAANEGVPRAADGSMQIVDEWTWHNASLVGTHDRTELLEAHWKEWVTRDDLVALQQAGITHLRIPVGYWYWNCTETETFAATRASFPLALASLKTVVNKWAAELGLLVLLDMHTSPGSQNGFDNSGRRGEINLISQPDGSVDTVNVQRWAQSVQLLSGWAAQELDSKTLFGVEVLNEPFGAWGKMADAIKGTINPTGYQTVRRNAGSELNVVFQTGFIPVEDQDAYTEDTGYHHVWFDDHRYQCFGADNALTYSEPRHAGWAHHLNASCVHHYDHVAGNIWSFVGEWSLAVSDCAKYLSGGINAGCNMTADPSCEYAGAPTQAGHPEVCDYYTQPGASLSAEYKKFLLQFARAQMDGFEQSGNGWFFWNFKTEEHHAPDWDFLLGLKMGYIDPKLAARPVQCKQ